MSCFYRFSSPHPLKPPTLASTKITHSQKCGNFSFPTLLDCFLIRFFKFVTRVHRYATALKSSLYFYYSTIRSSVVLRKKREKKPHELLISSFPLFYQSKSLPRESNNSRIVRVHNVPVNDFNMKF